jgi:uncharacterized membrane protein YgcG
VLILRLCSCSESAYAICVFHILLHMCPHTEIYVSSCYYICVLILLCALILLHMCPETAIYAPPPKNWSRLLLLRRARAGGGGGGSLRQRRGSNDVNGFNGSNNGGSGQSATNGPGPGRNRFDAINTLPGFL